MTDTERAQMVKRVDDLVFALRVVGLFEDSVITPEEDRPIAVVDFLIGDLAFSKRIQEPEQVDFDAEFRAMIAPVAEDQNDDAIQGLLGMIGEP